jgi:hypothetical protein
MVCSLLVHLYRVSNVALRHMNKQVLLIQKEKALCV